MTPASMEKIIRGYYELIDAGKHEELLTLFDPRITYERGGTPTINGILQLREFYADVRIIEDGRHHVDQVLVNTDWAAARGCFEGKLKNGEQVALRFTDWFNFQDGRIIFRETIFPGRQV